MGFGSVFRGPIMSDETPTGLTMRLIRNEIIEQCAKVADEWLEADTNPGWDSACFLIARDIRALAVSSKDHRA